MDDIDRELKQIQLQRECLALERELKSRRWMENIFSAGPRGALWVANIVQSVLVGIGGICWRWWKLGIFGAAVTIAVVGAVTWMESVKQSKQDAAEAKYEAEVQKLVQSECGSNNCSIERDAGCWDTINQFPTCSRRVREAFASAEQTRGSGGKATPSK